MCFFPQTRKSSRSNSLERRKSGEGDVIINQSTVHGTASPNRRPTIFDVFRPRTKSDAKRKERELAKAQAASDKDGNTSSSSTHSHSGSGGIMHTMKAAMQHTIGTKSSDSKSSKFRDGSAHPHGGSDAQVWWVAFVICLLHLPTIDWLFKWLSYYLNFVVGFSTITRWRRYDELIMLNHRWLKWWICLGIDQIQLLRRLTNAKR